MPGHKRKPKARIEREEIASDSGSQNKRMGRRDLLKLAAQGLAVLALAGSVRFIDLARGGRGILRPPGALSEEHFRALCLPCGKCEEICPQGVIRPVRLEENIETAGSPRLSFAENYCNLCMECTKACPTGALQPIQQSEALIGIAKVITDRCVAWLGKSCGRGCNRCPFNAILMDGQNRPVINPELCKGCGICEVGCSLSINEFFTKGILVYPVGSPELG